MRVVVVGSRPRDMSEPDFENFKNACQELGKLIAERGYDVIIGSLRDDTADYHILKGMENAKTSAKPKIIFVRWEGDADTDLSFLSIDKFEVEMHKAKGEVRIIAMAKADVMLVIGGKGGTTSAGFAAFTLKRPVLALPQFDGAAKEIWNAVYGKYASVFSEKFLETLSGKWDSKTALAAIDAIKVISKNNPFDDKIRPPQIFLSFLSVVFIMAWIVIFSGAWDLDRRYHYIILFSMVVISSGIGTFARNFLKIYFDFSDVFSSKRILSEFVIGVIIGFGTLLIMQISGLLLKGDSISFSTADFRRLSVVMSLVALATSMLLERSVEQFRGRIEKYLDVEKVKT